MQLNHTIVSCRDQQRSAAFLTEILGLAPATRFAHFLVVEADNGVSLDFSETTGAITPQHMPSSSARRNSMRPLAASVARTCRTGQIPGRPSPGVINHRDGGRGLYFEDPDGHLLEIITRPYGSGS